MLNYLAITCKIFTELLIVKCLVLKITVSNVVSENGNLMTDYLS